MAISNKKRTSVREAVDRSRRYQDLKRFFPQYPMMFEANWDRETNVYYNEGRMTGIVLTRMAGRSDVVSSRPGVTNG